MTITDRIEAAVTIAQTLMRVRGQWHRGATAHVDILDAVEDSNALLSLSSSEHVNAVQELKRRSGY